MKKYLSNSIIPILTFVFFGIRGNAQITVSYYDMPAAGSVYVMAVDTSKAFTPQPASSSAQTWNFSALGNIQTNSYNFVNPDWTPYYFAFHSSNLADSLYYGSGFTYHSLTPGSYSETGFAEQLLGYTVGITAHPFFEQISLPATYLTMDGGVSRGDTTMAFNYLIYDSARATVTIDYADTMDAFGTMTTPYGTEGVIRQKHYDKTVDSAFVHIKSGSWMLYKASDSINYQYRWYAQGINYFFAVMQMDTKNQNVVNTQWLNKITVGIDNISHTTLTTIYPNPCSTQITFKCNSTDASRLSVFDITGRQLSTYEIRNGELNLNTSGYSAGMYFYRISNTSGNILDRGKFSVQ